MSPETSCDNCDNNIEQRKEKYGLSHYCAAVCIFNINVNFVPSASSRFVSLQWFFYPGNLVDAATAFIYSGLLNKRQMNNKKGN